MTPPRITPIGLAMAAMFALSIAAAVWLESDLRRNCERRGGTLMFRSGRGGSFVCMSRDGRILW